MDNERLTCRDYRDYGGEIEINALDLIAHGSQGPPPEGIDYVSCLVNKSTSQSAQVKAWEQTHNNLEWVLKPDASAGIEICSPVLKSWEGLSKLCRVADVLHDDKDVQADFRCSLHIHTDITDLYNSEKSEELAKLIAYWIKCELVLMDSVPFRRKNNKYCQLISATNLLNVDSKIAANVFIQALGKHKYTSFNTYHLRLEKRYTVEFRIMENDACLDSFMTKNWTRFVLHFINMAVKAQLPPPYKPGNINSGLCLYDLADVIKFLRFDGSCELSPGLKQVRNWFLGRLYYNISDVSVDNSFWKVGREISKRQLTTILGDLEKREGIKVNKEWVAPSNVQQAVYGEEYIE